MILTGLGDLINKINVLHFFTPSKHERRQPELSIIERMSSILAVFYGLFLMNPLTDSFHISPIYISLSQLAPEMAWGILFFIVGLSLRLAWVNDRRNYRRLLTLLLGLMWFFLTFSFILSVGLNTPAVSTYGIIAIYTLWAYVRIPRGQL